VWLFICKIVVCFGAYSSVCSTVTFVMYMRLFQSSSLFPVLVFPSLGGYVHTARRRRHACYINVVVDNILYSVLSCFCLHSTHDQSFSICWLPWFDYVTNKIDEKNVLIK
jgi:hypothetical protein